MINVDLIYNLSVLVALSVLSGFIDKRFDRDTISGKILQGILFASTVIIGMNYPFILTEGIIFDGRSIIISLAALFFGPIPGLISAISAAAYRIYLGGGGALMGVGVITESFIIGYIFYRLRKKQPDYRLTNLNFYLLGILVHVVMVLLMFTLPKQNIVTTLTYIVPTVIGVYPIITLLIGKILLDQEEKKKFENKLRESESLYRTTFFSIGDGVISTDKLGKIVNINLVAEELTGYKSNEVKDKYIEDVFNIVNQQTGIKVENPVRKVLQNGKIIGLANHTVLIAKNGKKLPIADSGAPIKNEKGEIVGAVIVFRDQTEEYNARMALENSEAKFKSVINNAPMGLHIYELKENGNLILTGANPAADTILQKDHSLWFGKDIKIVFSTLSDDLVANYKKIAKEGGEWETETKYLDNGQIVAFFDIKVFQISTNRMAVFFTNVTQRKLDTIKIKESEDRYKSIIAVSNTGAWEYHSNKDFLWCSKEYFEMLGYGDEFGNNDIVSNLKESWIDLLHPEDKNKAVKDFNEYLSGGSIGMFETYYRMVHKSGKIIWIWSRGQTLLNSDGSATQLTVGTNIDITEKKLAEDALKAAESKYRILVEHSQSIIYTISPDGVFTYVSPSWKNLLGMDVNQVVGKNYQLFVYKEDIPVTLAYLEESIKNGTNYSGCAYRIYHENGTIRWHKSVVTPIFDENHNLISLVGNAVDITESKQSEMLLHDIVDKNPIAYQIVDVFGKTIMVNESYIKLFGILPPVNHSVFNDISLKKNGMDDLMMQLKNNEIIHSPDFCYNVHDLDESYPDKPAWISMIAYPLFNVLGNVKNYVIMHEDVAERKRTEEILKIQYNIAYAMATVRDFDKVVDIVRSELGRLIDTNNFYIAFYNEKTGLLHSVSERDEKDYIPDWPADKSLTGYVIKENMTKLVDDDEFQRLLKSGVVEIVGEPSAIWLGVPLRIKEKAVGAICVQSYDNAYMYDENSVDVLEMIANQLGAYLERKQAEDLLLESEDKFRSFAELAPFAIMIYQGEYWVYTNPAGEKITGYTADELYKLKYWEFVSPKYTDLVKNNGIKRQKGESIETSYEFSIITKDGITKWIFLTGRQIVYMGKPAGFISVVDITERKKMEQELVDARDKAEEMNRIKSYFFANMSHELRTPFMPIMGYAELLSSTLTDPDEKEMADAILFSSRRLTETLKNVLDLTRLEFDKIEISVTRVNLVSLIREIYFLFRETAKKKGIELRTGCDEEEIYSITEEQFMREILTNFVSNAIKFTEEGYVEISLKQIYEEDKSYVLITVKDTGVGIPKSKQGVIWDEFRQVSEGTTRNFQGSGLGLSIVKRYVELIGAEVYLDSDEGKGSAFTVKLLAN